MWVITMYKIRLFIFRSVSLLVLQPNCPCVNLSIYAYVVISIHFVCILKSVKVFYPIACQEGATFANSFEHSKYPIKTNNRELVSRF